MKILEVKIYSPDSELLRKVEFKDIGLSIIYGDVEKPNNDNETSNSIGKTVLLKILNVILGAKNSGKNTIRGLKDYKIESEIKYNNKKYKINLTIGSSKDYFVEDRKMNLTQYKEFFNIDRKLLSKQIMLEKRKALISDTSKNATKDDYSAVLNLLYLNDIESVFRKIKEHQDEIELIGKYNNTFKEDTNILQKEEFNLEMKKKQIEDELQKLNNNLSNLKISENIQEIAKRRMIVDQEIKEISENIQINNMTIKKYNEILEDSKGSEISLKEVRNIYNTAKIEIPEMINKKLEEIENFYKYLIEDKNEIYKNQINTLNEKNIKLKNQFNELKIEFDNLSEIISENNSFKEAIKIYDIKTREKMEIDSKISEINGKLTQINNTHNIKANIDILYSELYKEFESANLKINRYKQFIYEMVNKIYIEETRNPYLSINISDSKLKYKAIPIKIDLSIDGDDGEGIGAVRYLLFDLMIMNYNNEIECMIEDSSCFEGIDRRQVKKLIMEFKRISETKNKQLIISLNKYLISDMEDLKDNIVLKLDEGNTLLNRKF